MLVLMCVWFAGRVGRCVHVLMVLIMDMPVLMLQRPVSVFMVVPFSEVQVEPDRHQCSGTEQLGRNRLIEQRNAEGRPKERRHGEIGACSGRP